MGHKHNLVFPEDVYIFCFETIVFSMGTHCKTKCLAHHIVKWHGQEIASYEKKAQAVYSIELSPLCFLFENFVYFYSLSSFSDWKG